MDARRLLVVEDEPLLASLVVDALRTAGFEVEGAASASWNIQSSWKGKNLSCLTLAYANNATGSTSVSAVVPPL